MVMSIPLNKRAKSPRNVRCHGDPTADAELNASIAARSLLPNSIAQSAAQGKFEAEARQLGGDWRNSPVGLPISANRKTHDEAAISAEVTLASAPPPRLLRLPEVINRVGLRRSSIYQRMSKGLFPRCRSLGPKFSVWVESEINEWIETIVGS